MSGADRGRRRLRVAASHRTRSATEAGYLHAELRSVHWLGQEAPEASARCAFTKFFRRQRCEGHGWYEASFFVSRTNTLDEAKTVTARHLQVRDDHVWTDSTQRVERFASTARCNGPRSATFEDRTKQLEHVFVVIDDQHNQTGQVRKVAGRSFGVHVREQCRARAQSNNRRAASLPTRELTTLARRAAGTRASRQPKIEVG